MNVGSISAVIGCFKKIIFNNPTSAVLLAFALYVGFLNDGYVDVLVQQGH